MEDINSFNAQNSLSDSEASVSSFPSNSVNEQEDKSQNSRSSFLNSKTSLSSSVQKNKFRDLQSVASNPEVFISNSDNVQKKRNKSRDDESNFEAFTSNSSNIQRNKTYDSKRAYKTNKHLFQKLQKTANFLNSILIALKKNDQESQDVLKQINELSFEIQEISSDNKELFDKNNELVFNNGELLKKINEFTSALEQLQNQLMESQSRLSHSNKVC